MDAASRLRILDIALWESHLTRQVEYPQWGADFDPQFQTMRDIKIDFVTAVDDDGSEADILKVFIALGIRCIKPSNEADKEPEVLHSLESIFAVDYAYLEAISEDELEEFARFNSVHNVWPFWRQHVYETMKKASLPTPAIPFFPGRMNQPLASAEPPENGKQD